jgi:hypothetical protein
MDCHLDVYSHILYKPLWDCDDKQKKNLMKQLSFVKINVSII